MRKIYESEKDRENQVRIAEYLTEAWDCGYIKTPPLFPVDGAIVDLTGRMIALVEIKVRSNASNKYPTYMLSAGKWREAIKMCKQENFHFMLVVEFTDGIFAAKVKDDYPIAKGGRRDRNDARDIEDCIYIPMSEFKKV